MSIDLSSRAKSRDRANTKYWSGNIDPRDRSPTKYSSKIDGSPVISVGVAYLKENREFFQAEVNPQSTIVNPKSK
jgi:hypothetical protein